MTTREIHAPAASLAVPVRRLVWCSAGGRILHGRTRPAPSSSPGFLQRLLGIQPHGGTIFEFEAIEVSAAVAALEAHLAAPGTFAIETAEGARLDFLAAPARPSVTLDCWFFEPEAELDSVVLDGPAARIVLASLYELARDCEVAARVRELARAHTAA